MSAVEDPCLSVVELAEQEHATLDEEPYIRRGEHERLGTVIEAAAELLEEALGLLEVLENVQQEQVIVLPHVEFESLSVEIGLENFDTGPGFGRRVSVHHRHLAPLEREEARHTARTGSEIQHFGTRGHRLQGVGVARGIAELQGVWGVALRRDWVQRSLVEESSAVRHVPHRRNHHLLRVAHAVQRADLRSVIDGNWQLPDADARIQQLENDLGIEMEVVRIELEPDLLERLYRVHPVAAVQISETGPEQNVLHGRQNPVAGEFVEGHGHPAQRADHPATEHRVCLPVAQRRNQSRKLLGRIRSVAVEDGHEVESLANGVAVADLLGCIRFAAPSCGSRGARSGTYGRSRTSDRSMRHRRRGPRNRTHRRSRRGSVPGPAAGSPRRNRRSRRSRGAGWKSPSAAPS